MPGAGKSTLLAGLPAGPGTGRCSTRRPTGPPCSRLLPGVPYAWYRPLVHLWHRLAVLLAALSEQPDAWWCTCRPPTSGPGSAVARLARLTGRSAHLLWLHVDPAEARRGQLARGRVVPEPSFAAHAEQAARTRPRCWPARRRPAGPR